MKDEDGTMRKALCILAVLAGLVAVLVVVCDLRVRCYSKGRLYTDLAAVPYRHAALLLGTSSSLRNGSPNPYFKYRIDAAAALLAAGKVDKILVSGDNRHASYNEPQKMLRALISRGVPDSLIVLDYAGFRTLDSVVRAREVFGQSSFIVVSQRFHNERALFLAGKHGIDAVGFNASDVRSLRAFRTHARELLARVKVFIDLAVHRGPHFLGERVEM